MEIERVELDERAMLGITETVPFTALREFFGRAFGTVAAQLAAQGVTPAGPAVALYGSDVGEAVTVTAGFPVSAPVTPMDGTVLVSLRGGPAAVALHEGPYDTLASSYAEVEAWMKGEGERSAGEMWEEYLVGPGDEPDPDDWQTSIVFPLKP